MNAAQSQCLYLEIVLWAAEQIWEKIHSKTKNSKILTLIHVLYSLRH